MNEEMDPVGTEYNKAFILKCEGYIIAKLLINNGSTFNVLPCHIMNQLPID